MSIENLISRYKRGRGQEIYVDSFTSPMGVIISAADDFYVYIVTFEDSKNCEKMFKTLYDKLSCIYIEKTNTVTQDLHYELSLYFKGKLIDFTIPLKLFGSHFQKTVWEKLAEIPYGETQTYSDIAKALARPRSHARAVGAACGANMHVIVIPCHRVVARASNGGYSCGIDRKDKLIQLEKQRVQIAFSHN